MEHLFTENDIKADFQKAWDKGTEETGSIPLKPPYERWDKEGKKMHFVADDF